MNKNPYIEWVLRQVELAGSMFEPMSLLEEGPRRVGECVYCAGPCHGATGMCEWRVFADRTGKCDP